MENETGKGDTYRPVDKQKYNRNYLRIFGVRCKRCNGKGCEECEGYGYKERQKN